MSLFSKLILFILILNGIQNIILAYVLRSIASKMGKEPNYFTRMLSDQIFLYKELKLEKNIITKGNQRLLYYSTVTAILQMVLGIIFIVSLTR